MVPAPAAMLHQIFDKYSSHTRTDMQRGRGTYHIDACDKRQRTRQNIRSTHTDRSQAKHVDRSHTHIILADEIIWYRQTRRSSARAKLRLRECDLFTRATQRRPWQASLRAAFFLILLREQPHREHRRLRRQRRLAAPRAAALRLALPSGGGGGAHLARSAQPRSDEGDGRRPRLSLR